MERRRWRQALWTSDWARIEIEKRGTKEEGRRLGFHRENVDVDVRSDAMPITRLLVELPDLATWLASYSVITIANEQPVECRKTGKPPD